MSPPFAFKAYHRLKAALTPSYTGEYLLIEAMFVAVTLAAALAQTTSLLGAFALALGPVLFVIALLASVQRTQRLDEAVILTQPLWRFGTSTALALVPALLFGLLTGLDSTPIEALLGGGPVVIYAGLLHHRGQKYRGDRQFFTNAQSRKAREWYDASVAFEQGIHHFDLGNEYRAYHWLKTASEAYDAIETYSQRERHRRIAHELNAAASVLVEDVCLRDAVHFWDEYESHLAAAIDATQYARCDVCSRTRHITDCHRIIDDEGIEREILCGRCHFQRRRPGPTAQDPTQETEDDSQTSTDTGRKQRQNTSRQRRQKPPAEVNEEPEMSVADAREELNLDASFDADDITDAFRNRVKETHPDMGGSTEAFKRVKQARERLETEVE